VSAAPAPMTTTRRGLDEASDDIAQANGRATSPSSFPR
jgi:hypothetical protein